MADFKAGDRVVKMSGAAAGKYGTVNSVREDGTLNVTFDGERLPRYCDPERCGQVAANAKFKVGDVVTWYEDLVPHKGAIVRRVLGGDVEITWRGKTLVVEDNDLVANAVRNERIRAYPDGPGEWILVDAVGDEGFGRTTATDERGIKAQLADIAVRTYRWHRPEIVIMREKYYSNAARNARALNWNYRNSYQFFCVDPSMKAPCIYSGWDYREDAKDDAAELKELGIPHKIVSRRFLEQNGIDPNAEVSWKKNR